MRFRTPAAWGMGVLATALVASSFPAAAQDQNTDARLKRVEAEVRALQRKVFPGPDGKFFQPEVSTAQTQAPASATLPGAPSTSAVTDILSRLDALEAQVQRLTAANEQYGYEIRGLTDRVKAIEAAAAAPLPAATAGGVGNTTTTTQPASTSTAAPTPSPASAPSAERLAKINAIQKPQTGDDASDEYTYGFRLWDAKLYPEAEQQLTKFVEKYPDSSMISYGRNLLGRAYLDDGKPKQAAPWLLKNYQADKTGARAGDSLLYLAESMIALKDTKRACIALTEFADTYPALATGRLKVDYQADRAKANCH
ncbi:MAG: tetratricopeptide repeat protein [Sphingomonadaceae bacterium]